MSELAPLARLIWRRLEPLHAMTYFAKESQVAYEAVGMKGFWMGYFGGRAAALGKASPELVTSTFYNFHRSRVERAVPDCWAITTPTAILKARNEGMLNALNATHAINVGDLRTLAPLVANLAEATTHDIGGRPLFAAHSSVPWPDEGPGLQAWWAATLIREHRGDGHIAALVDAEVAPCEALVLQMTYAGVPRETLQGTRNWPDDEWAAAIESLQSRGWLAADETATEAGRAGLAAVEARTDELALRPLRAIGEAAGELLAEAALPVAQAVMASGVVPAVTPIFADDLP